MKPANFAPIYLGLYPKLTELVRSHGYALAAHGTLARDFDLICIPWVEKPSTPDEVVRNIVEVFGIRQEGKPEIKLHNRLVYTLTISFDTCFIDLSFMPVVDYSPDLGSVTCGELRIGSTG